MNGYLLSVMGTVLVCALLTAIAPEGKTSSVIKGIARLACVLTIISPVLHFFKTGETDVYSKEKNLSESVISEDGSFIQYCRELRVRETETAIEKELNERFDFQGEVTLVWTIEKELVDDLYETERIRITQIQILPLCEVGEEVKRSVRRHVIENYCSEVLLE